MHIYSTVIRARVRVRPHITLELSGAVGSASRLRSLPRNGADPKSQRLSALNPRVSVWLLQELRAGIRAGGACVLACLSVCLAIRLHLRPPAQKCASASCVIAHQHRRQPTVVCLRFRGFMIERSALNIDRTAQQRRRLSQHRVRNYITQ